MAHIKEVKIENGDTYLIEPAVYAVTAGTASAITANIPNFALDTGVVVTLKITNTNAAGATLKIKDTEAKNIRYNDANIAVNALKANRFYSFVYDGTYWQLIGELDTDTNTWRSISDAINSTSSDVSASSKAVKTAYDLAAEKVSKSGDTMTGPLIASASENSISDIKYYNHSTYAGGTYTGWVKIAQIDLQDNNRFGYHVIDFYLARGYNSPAPETYNIRVTTSWNAVNIIQLGGSVSGNIIEKFRVVKDNTNHKVFFEYNVKTSASSLNTVYIRIIQYVSSNLILLNEVQTEEDSAFANTWEIELANNKIVSDINGTATNVTGTVAIDHGGTNATTAKGARTSLGLGTMATETAANYLKLSGGTMKGQLKWANSSALPSKENPEYFLAIDAFANGGTTYYVNKANLRTSLGLSNAMHFLGITTTNISTGTPNTTATISISDSDVTATAGDVVLYGSQEYVWGNNRWNLLGDESSYALKATTLSGYGITDAKITNGVITLGNNTITPLTSQYTTHLYINTTSSGATSNATTSNTTTYIHLYDTTTKRETIQLKGAGGTTVEANTSGVITITSANDDIKVKQTNVTNNVNYKLLTTTSASPQSGSAAEAYYNTNITANPSTGSISAPRHTLNLNGTDKAYMIWNDTDQSIDFIFE